MCSKEQEFIKVNSETPSTVWPPSKSQLAHHKLKTISTGRLFGVTLIFPAHQLNCTNSKPILMHDMDDDWTLSDGSSEGWEDEWDVIFFTAKFDERQQWCQSLCWEEILLQRTLLPLSMPHFGHEEQWCASLSKITGLLQNKSRSGRFKTGPTGQTKKQTVVQSEK